MIDSRGQGVCETIPRHDERRSAVTSDSDIFELRRDQRTGAALMMVFSLGVLGLGVWKSASPAVVVGILLVGLSVAALAPWSLRVSSDTVALLFRHRRKEALLLQRRHVGYVALHYTPPLRKRRARWTIEIRTAEHAAFGGRAGRLKVYREDAAHRLAARLAHALEVPVHDLPYTAT
jgi:hypothetical protein